MKKKIGLSIVLLIVCYGLWNGRNLLLGPQINIDSPNNNQSFQQNLIKVSGTAQNIAFISMDGRRIFIDPKGNFSEDALLLPGYNVIELQGQDRFGKEEVKRLQLYYVAQATSSIEIGDVGTTTSTTTNSNTTQ